MNGMNRSEYEMAVNFAQQGKHQEALVSIERYLQSSPDDVEALNDAGAIYHCVGRSSQAIEYLKKARNLNPQNKQVVLNMLEVYIALSMPQESEEILELAQELGILNPEILNRITDQHVQNGKIADAVEILLRSHKLWPNQEIVEHMLTILKSKRAKLAFFCGPDGPTFLNPVIDNLRERFNVRLFDGTTNEELYELMNWSDISWFEWCTDLAAIGTAGQKVCKNIIRLHRYEAYTDWPQKINWHNVDVMVTVGNSVVKNYLISKIPQITGLTSMTTIPNGVDLEKITFVDKKAGKNLAFIGNGREVKNLPLVMQCMQKLNYIDDEYKLYIAGIFTDPVLEQYIRHMVHVLGLDGVVICDGWQDDINRWLSDKHYIISSSLIESQGMGILEGMAAGLKPVIHNFPGAEEIYPKEYLFNIAEEFCQQIISAEYESVRYRRFVEQRYSRKQQLKDINKLITEFEKEIGPDDIKSNIKESLTV
jgi:tetratricopeptide (TPR) repeat protein